jgi:hypothetical protein
MTFFGATVASTNAFLCKMNCFEHLACIGLNAKCTAVMLRPASVAVCDAYERRYNMIVDCCTGITESRALPMATAVFKHRVCGITRYKSGNNACVHDDDLSA